VQEALNEKKKAFKEWQGVDENDKDLKENKRDVYKQCKRCAKKAIATARAQAQVKIYEGLNSPAGQKHLFRIARERERSARDINHIKCIKDDEGKVLMDDDDIKQRWKEYFEKLMNEENIWSGVLEEVPVNIGMVKEISVEEVKKAVQGMKNGKAVGPDGIPVEVWKLLKADGWVWLTLFFNKLLQEEVIPDEWCARSLVPIFKNKGDVQICNNYRGIKLMSHSMKAWERVVDGRIREESE
ncbi:PREDICTED: uncharacterized protein LOC106119245, partial [Papilio xuthus]|uniref:Uncharacterized protein LOC106119245 n=1 Tax=Papilio xuthus TaxID=66420 RepID=A0AAJ6ZCF3_PAPXU